MLGSCIFDLNDLQAVMTLHTLKGRGLLLPMILLQRTSHGGRRHILMQYYNWIILNSSVCLAIAFLQIPSAKLFFCIFSFNSFFYLKYAVYFEVSI